MASLRSATTLNKENRATTDVGKRATSSSSSTTSLAAAAAAARKAPLSSRTTNTTTASTSSSTTGSFSRSTSSSRVVSEPVNRVRQNATSTARKTLTQTARTSATVAPPTKRSRSEAFPEETEGNGYDHNQFSSVVEKVAELQSKMMQSDSRVEQLERALQAKEEVLQTMELRKTTLMADVSGYQMQIDDANRRNSQLLELLETVKHQNTMQVQEYTMKLQMVQSQYDSLTVQHKMLDNEVANLRRTTAEQRSRISEQDAQISMLEGQLKDKTETLQRRDETISQHEATIAQKTLTISQLEAQVRDDEMLRRKLHNTIQELKGNIRVFCRVRPILQGVGSSSSSSSSSSEDIDSAMIYSFPQSGGAKTLDIEVPQNLSALVSSRFGAKEKRWQFTFDKVFAPGTAQGRVFEEISALVQSSLDGYNTCIFAYGQTGSGKTFTMEGPESPDQDTMGMIPRAVQMIFETAKRLREQGWVYEFQASFLEIYNEKLRDLLVSDTVDEKNRPKLDVKHVKENSTTTVSGLTYVKVTHERQVGEFLARASRNRAVAATQCNERSSRSHSVFQLQIKGENQITSESVSGILNLIDLAGSERLASSKAVNERFTETVNINKSLSSLGKVIMALANKESHIPYRDSKLTYLLQNSLGGNSKTLMFVNVSPAISDLNESLNSLRFATKVNACEIGVARKAAKHDLTL